jgi:hypothetical protein
LQKWDGSRPSILNLIGSFYSFSIAKKIDEEKRAKTSNYVYHNNHTKNIIGWIEKLLEVTLEDNRKFCLWRIIISYLKNIKKLTIDESISILIKWLDECDQLNKLDFEPSKRVKENIKYVKNYLPTSS